MMGRIDAPLTEMPCWVPPSNLSLRLPKESLREANRNPPEGGVRLVAPVTLSSKLER
jgi:hypothetical protein